MKIERNPTRPVRIGSVTIGNGHPIAVQSMTATKTQDIEATVELVNLLSDAGADVVRIAVDSKKDAAEQSTSGIDGTIPGHIKK